LIKSGAKIRASAVPLSTLFLNTREYNALHENALGKKEDRDRQDPGDERPRLEQIGLLTI
jgi:hypothetical protein